VSHALSDIRSYFVLADIPLFLTHRECFDNVAIKAVPIGFSLAFYVTGIKDKITKDISGLKFPQKDNTHVFEVISSLIERKLRTIRPAIKKIQRIGN